MNTLRRSRTDINSPAPERNLGAVSVEEVERPYMPQLTPRPLKQHIANFVAGFYAFSFGSGIFLMPQIESNAKGELFPLLGVFAFCFFGWKASDLFVEAIKSKEFSKKRENSIIWCLPIFYIFVISCISVILAVSSAFFIPNSQPKTLLPTPQPISEELSPEIDIVFSSQPAEGATQEDMNESFLKFYETYSLERMQYHIEEAKKSGLQTISPEQITAVSGYVDMGEKKLAVIRMSSPIDTAVFVLGIMNDELKRVGCMHGSQNSIPITYGKCGDKIKEVFNLR
ncbi:MAG: hypothetical protein ACRBDI_10545 [Alphaproteobacteria bacterium]